MDDQSQTPRNKRKLILQIAISAVVIIIAAVSIVIGLKLIENAADNKKDQPSASSNPLRAHVDERKHFEKGSVAQFGHFEVTINKATKNYASSSFQPRGKNNTFVLLNLTVKNTDASEHGISDFNLGLLADDAIVNPFFGGVEPYFKTKTLKTGETNTGNILYEVPMDTKDLKLYYNTRLYNETDQKLEKIEYTLSF